MPAGTGLGFGDVPVFFLSISLRVLGGEVTGFGLGVEGRKGGRMEGPKLTSVGRGALRRGL